MGAALSVASYRVLSPAFIFLYVRMYYVHQQASRCLAHNTHGQNSHSLAGENPRWRCDEFLNIEAAMRKNLRNRRLSEHQSSTEDIHTCNLEHPRGNLLRGERGELGVVEI